LKSWPVIGRLRIATYATSSHGFASRGSLTLLRD
jgi:hypothetical protein